MPRPNVVVIGGGVIGITSAVCLLRQFPDCNLTIYSEDFTPNTTGDGSAGFWEPFQCPGTSQQDIIRWSKATWDLFYTWWQSGMKGVHMVKTYNYSVHEEDLPYWKNIPLNTKKLTPSQVKEFSNGDYASGFEFWTLVAEPKQFLKHLMDELRWKGAVFYQQKVLSFEDIADGADLILNCSGIGAYDLVPDHTVFPIRGQILMIDAPWVKENRLFGKDDYPGYTLVNEDFLIVGGTTQKHNWSTQLSSEDSRKILETCTRALPSLKKAKVLKEWVGLRPARENGVRIEIERRSINGRQIPVVHNYGHGGSGVTLAWGCAQDVTHLAVVELQQISQVQAKL